QAVLQPQVLLLNRSVENSNKNKTTVKRLPPTAPAARDEGPRLLPLGVHPKEPSRLEHYLDLADAALGLRKKDAICVQHDEFRAGRGGDIWIKHFVTLGIDGCKLLAH